MVFPLEASFQRIRQLATFSRFVPFDTSTAEGLAKERYRRAALTTLTSAIAKGVAILTGLISVPLTLTYLGTERYGLWMAISSVMLMLGFADFGLGNGLVNSISEADGRNDQKAAMKAASSAFFMLLGIALLFTLLFGSTYFIVSWPSIFNVNSPKAAQEAGPAMVVFFVCFALNLPLGIVQRTQIGYQEAFISNLWQIAGNVLGLVVLLVMIQFKMGLPYLVFAMSGIPTVTMGINWLLYFLCKRTWLLPCWASFDWNIAKKLFRTGGIFVLLGIVSVLGTTTDNIIIAQSLGISAVATYAVVQRLFSLTLLVQMITAPLWPAFSEAFTRGDHSWAFHCFKRMQIISIGITLAISLPLLFFGQIIIRWWGGPSVVPPWSLLAGYGVYRIVCGFSEAAIPVLQTKPFIHRFLLIASVAGIITFLLKIMMVRIWQSPGVIWAGAIGYGLFFTVPASAVVYHRLRRGHEKVNNK